MTRTEEILWRMLISYSAQSLKGKVSEEQLGEIVKRAAAEIKDIPNPADLADKLKEGI